ncbi:MAG: DMT family transporter [Pseudomonadota bacterium]
MLLAHLATTDEKLTRARGLGVVLGLAGVVVLVGPGALAGLGTAVLAQVAVLGATLSYGLASLWGRRFRRLGIDPVEAATGQLAASTAILTLPALVLTAPWALPAPGVTVWAAMLGLGTLSTALAYVLFFRVLQRAGAGNVMLVTLMVPPSAILLGWLVLDERLGPEHLAGMALIAAGLVVIDGRLAARVSATGQ